MRRIVLAIALSAIYVNPAAACGDETTTLEGTAVAGIPVAGSGPSSAGCPGPDCAATTSGDFGHSPFTRLTASGPIHNVGCFAVLKKNANSYRVFIDSGATFERSWSADGLTNWSARRPCYGLTSESWAKGVQCPDPHYAADGSMYMYYNVKRSGQWAIARATSTDNGANWTMNPNPVVIATATHYPYMPSVLEYKGKLLLTYAWVCTGSVTAMADIHVKESTDGGNTWTFLTQHAISEGACSEWDNASVNRPRLVPDPNGEALYMFFSGFPWNPTTKRPTRKWSAIGVAKSCDGGSTWTKASKPVFERELTGWEDKSVLKPSLVWDDSGVRLYYEAANTASLANGLGAAETTWPLPPMFSPLCMFPARPSGGETFSTSTEMSDGLARISSSPNPTSGLTRIGIELAQRSRLANIEVDIFDVNGRAVLQLWSGSASGAPSEVVWDGRLRSGASAPSGRYLVQVTSAGVTLGTHWITKFR